MMKVPTGIEVLDRITEGGLPDGRMTLVQGHAGAGKTLLSLHVLLEGVIGAGGSGVFVCFEETEAEIVRDAAALGWDLAALRAAGRLAIVEFALDPDMEQSGPFDLNGVLAMVEARVAQTGARVVVFDSLDVLSNFIGDADAERREFYRLKAWLRAQGLTGIVTGKAPAAGANGDAGHDFLPFMADACIELGHARFDHLAQRTMRVSKLRGSGGAGLAVPFTIRRGGIVAAPPGSGEIGHDVSTERVSTGVRRLDTLLGGGYFRGSGVLVSGTPGTAKTSLAAAFLAAASKRGEQGLLVTFDEAPAQVLRNAASIGLDLATPHRDGRLEVLSLRTGAAPLEDHMIRIMEAVATRRPPVIAVDPVSALMRAPGRVHAVSPGQRLMDQAKAHGLTMLMTSLTDREDGMGTVDTVAEVSTIADTWLHLSLRSLGGERNRAIEVMKSRGTRHSQQVRELVLSDDGIDLEDVYTAGGQVLMGTARIEREVDQERAEAEARRANAERLRALKAEQARLEAELEKLRRLSHMHESEMRDLEAQENDRITQEARRRQRVFEARRGDRKREPGE